jgi:predicted enzyme related to lactoylglutathione lyase
MMAETADCLGRFVWHDMMTTDLDASLAFYRGAAGAPDRQC